VPAPDDLFSQVERRSEPTAAGAIVCSVCGSASAPYGYVNTKMFRTARARIENMRYFCWGHIDDGEKILSKG
jgi:hypothetical protein